MVARVGQSGTRRDREGRRRGRRFKLIPRRFVLPLALLAVPFVLAFAATAASRRRPRRPVAATAPPPRVGLVTIDSTTPDLAAGDNGDHVARLGFTNLTRTDVDVSAHPLDDKPKCKLTLDHASLAHAQHTGVQVTVPKACAPEGTFVFVVDIGDKDAPSQSFTVVAPVPAPVKAPRWWALWLFPVLLFRFAVVACAYAYFSGLARAPLTHLEATWSFKDSWASNVTAVGALATGIFGSTDAVSAALGPNAKPFMNVVVIGAAIATGLAAAGPVALTLFRKKDEKKSRYDHTVLGFLLAAAATLAGALGELGIVLYEEFQFGFDGWTEIFILIFAGAGIVLLGCYAAKTIGATISYETEARKPASKRLLRLAAALLNHPHVRQVLAASTPLELAAIPGILERIDETEIAELAASRGVPDIEERPLRTSALL